MLCGKIKYDKLRDIEEVVPDLAIDIEDAISTGIVKSTVDTTPYTKETDVKAVGSYVTEPIDIAMAQMRLGASMAAANNQATSAE